VWPGHRGKRGHSRAFDRKDEPKHFSRVPYDFQNCLMIPVVVPGRLQLELKGGSCMSKPSNNRLSIWFLALTTTKKICLSLRWLADNVSDGGGCPARRIIPLTELPPHVPPRGKGAQIIGGFPSD